MYLCLSDGIFLLSSVTSWKEGGEKRERRNSKEREEYHRNTKDYGASQVVLVVKNPRDNAKDEMEDTRFQSLGWEKP